MADGEVRIAPSSELLRDYDYWTPTTIAAWDVPSIKSALDLHDDGDLSRSSALWDRLGRDGRVKSAREQRRDAVMGLPLVLDGAARAWEGRGLAESIRVEAEDIFAGGACSAELQEWMLDTRTGLGVAIAQVRWRTEILGSGQLRWTPYAIDPWPMHATRWDTVRQGWQGLTKTGLVDIEPGTGKWLVHGGALRPWLDGAVRPLGLTWADKLYAQGDRSRRAHASALAAIIGEMPEGVSITSDEGKAFKAMLQGLQKGTAGGIRPTGAKTEAVEMDSLVYRIFESIIDDAIDEVAVVVLGQTGTTKQGGGLGDGGNKVHDGVRYDLLERDVGMLYGVRAREGRAAVPGTLSGQLLRPWALLNWGRAELAPLVVRPVPDIEEDARIAAEAARHQAFLGVLAAYKAAGIAVDEEQLAAQLGVRVPRLAAPAAA